uniref:Uncharacterized protein n=1 Tax=Arundo donax TaxID=35708 RepID=A0A0A9CG26_ARUDO
MPHPANQTSEWLGTPNQASTGGEEAPRRGGARGLPGDIRATASVRDGIGDGRIFELCTDARAAQHPFHAASGSPSRSPFSSISPPTPRPGGLPSLGRAHRRSHAGPQLANGEAMEMGLASSNSMLCARRFARI